MPAVRVDLGVARDADLAVDARLDRRDGIAAEALGAVIRQAGVPGSGSEASGSAGIAARACRSGLKLALPLF